MSLNLIPLDPESFLKNNKASIPGSFIPAVDAASGIKDYSRWLFKPSPELGPNQQFTITFCKNIKNTQGKRLNRNITCHITTAPKLKMLYCSNKNGSSMVHLYPTVKFEYNQCIKSASIILKNLKTGKNSPGKIQLRDKTVIYTPYNALLPGTKYKLTITAVAETGEKSKPIDICFSTITMKNKYWMDVKLGSIHTVTVYKDQYPVRIMMASGGRRGHETPKGTFYICDRGSSFWSPRFGEGATYWVRIVGDILIHSIPKDESWTTKKDEHAKLGLPASHGCIRLAEPDAKWIYNNIPSHTMIIIHE
ncbi:MAG: L,D-transpeptidase family protein [Desulfotomaculum sp.]|nr:L,D-transpeptidase family protein [Desulfotomaculum sp.]